MHIVSVINYKGGVGKTAVTANLAGELAYRGYKVLLIDMDPQCSLTFSFISPEQWYNDYESSSTIKNWFDSLNSAPKPLSDLIFSPRKVKRFIHGEGKLDLIASHLSLINVDLELATELGGASLKQAKKNYIKVHLRLAEGLRQIKEESYDIVLIDCPPNFNIVTKNAIVASDNLLIPAKPDYLSTLGIDYLRRSVKELVENFNEFVDIDDRGQVDKIDPQILGVVFTMVQEYGKRPISTMRPYISQTKKLEIPTFGTYIKENKSLFADSPQYGVPVVMQNFSNTSHSRVVTGLEKFAGEFIKKLGI
ncbi:hypothetical protein LCGC14_2302710 [marine sediment metagenome]|uniref:AAA domain-containing protein n=1 Tax=marine sediment metagenome TaxID=412755 RepID=A0A0F9FHW5_9ZZZZ